MIDPRDQHAQRYRLFSISCSDEHFFVNRFALRGLIIRRESIQSLDNLIELISEVLPVVTIAKMHRFYFFAIRQTFHLAAQSIHGTGKAIG